MAGDRDYAAIAHDFARAAIKDKKRFGKWVRLAAQRHLDDLKRAKKKDWPYKFDTWHAADVCGFIEKLPHVEGVWDSPTLVLEPWQIFCFAMIFGWRRKSDGLRRFNTVYLEVARKNGKSPIASAVALYCLTCEGENGPQVKTAATTGDQARIVFDVAKKMVQRTPDLAEAFDLEVLANSIACHMNGGSVKPINAKASTQDGLNPHCAIIDELHAHADRSLFDVLRSARGARRNPLSFYITTAGKHLESVCFEQRGLVCKVLEGALDLDHYFGIIFTIDEDDDPYDEAVWQKANPNLGVSVQLDELRQYAREAQTSPDSEGEFKTKRLNVWLNAATNWLSLAAWDACADPDLTLEDDRFATAPAGIGVDLADKDDIAAVGIDFLLPNEDGEQVLYMFSRFYLPRDIVRRRVDAGYAHYGTWARAGLLTLTDGDWIDHRVIEDDIRGLCERFNVQGVAFDQYGGAQTMASRLVDQGINAGILAKNAKNFTDPAKEIEARVANGRLLRHDGNPVLRWMASNVVVDRRIDGSILPKKESANSMNKIDGIDAHCMAISQVLIPDAAGDIGFSVARL